LSLLRGPGKRRSPLKRGGVLTKGAKKLIVSLVALVVLVVAGGVTLAYAANSYPADPHAADNGGDHQGIDDIFFFDGLDGLLREAEDPEEPD